jgi:hypothetical protein
MKNVRHIIASDIIGIDAINHDFFPLDGIYGWSDLKKDIAEEEEILEEISGIENEDEREEVATEMLLDRGLHFEAGVCAATWALTLTGCFTTMSCGGHKKTDARDRVNPIIVFYLAPELLAVLSRLVLKSGLVLDDVVSEGMIPAGGHEPVCVIDPNGSSKAMLELAKAIFADRLAIEAIGERRFAMPKAEFKRFVKRWDAVYGQ